MAQATKRVYFYDNGELFDPFSIDSSVLMNQGRTGQIDYMSYTRESLGVYDFESGDSSYESGQYYLKIVWVAQDGMESNTSYYFINFGPTRPRIISYSRQDPNIVNIVVSGRDDNSVCRVYTHGLFMNTLGFRTEALGPEISFDVSNEVFNFFGVDLPAPICVVVEAVDNYGISKISNTCYPGFFSLIDYNTLQISDVIRSEDGTSVTFTISGMTEPGIAIVAYTTPDMDITAQGFSSNGTFSISGLENNVSYGFILIAYVDGQVSGIKGFSSNYPTEYNYLNTGRGKALPSVKVSETFDANKRTQSWVRVRE